MATRDDATLVVQILQWAAMDGFSDAIGKVNSGDFDAASATLDDPAVRKVLGFGEIIGTFVKQGLLDRDLVYDLWAFGYTWKRVEAAALRVREQTGEPRMYENYEALVKHAPEVAIKGSSAAAPAAVS